MVLKRFNHRSLLAIGSASLLTCCCAWALAGLPVPQNVDWPQWLGPHRNGQAGIVSLPADDAWPKALEREWQIDIGPGRSSPVVEKDFVYLIYRRGDDEVVQCVTLANGERKWQQSYPAHFDLPADGEADTASKEALGPRSTPILSQGKLFTVGQGGTVNCWDAKGGDPRWKKDFSEQFPRTALSPGVAASPLVEGTACLVHVGEGDHGALVSFDSKNGNENWRWTADGPALSSPMAVTLSRKKQLIGLTKSALVGIDPEDGQLLWKLPYETDPEGYAATPVVYEESILIGGAGHGIARIRVERNDEGWVTDEIWENKEVSLGLGTPIVVGDRLYGFSQRKKGQLFAIDLTTGKTLWQSPGQLGESAALVRTGDVIWALTTSGELIVFRDKQKQFVPLAKYQVSSTPTWAYPIPLTDGVLIRCESTLSRYRFPNKESEGTLQP